MENSKARPNAIDAIVSTNVRIFRLKQGLSQQELGKALDVSIQQIQKYEKATNRISAGKLKLMSDILKQPIHKFYEPAYNDYIINELDDSKLVQQLFKNYTQITDQRMKQLLCDLTKAMVPKTD